MAVQVMVFGRLTDIFGGTSVTVEAVPDTNQLVGLLNQRYPALVNAPYIVAVDKQVITGNTVLTDHSTVALLPPFAGG
jgi:sulfur-carrier protein